MSHAIDLIETFVAKIKKDYLPESGYKYLIEVRLMVEGVTFQPDIQVIDEAGRVVCVVEIGYTRPEKIALYKEIGIPDVRWYSKDGKFVNPHEGIHMTKVEVKYYPEFPEEETWREVDLDQNDGLICEVCRYVYREEEYMVKYEVPEELWEVIEYDHKDEDINQSALERYLEEADIFGELWSNGARWFCVWSCDECGDTGFMTGDQLKGEIFWDDFADEVGFSYDKFLQRHFKELKTPIETKGPIEGIVRGALYSELKKKASFEELRKYIFAAYDYEIEYVNIGRTPKYNH